MKTARCIFLTCLYVCLCICVCLSVHVRALPQGCLPLVLMFDIKEDIEVEPQCITALMEQLDVFISIKPKPKQPSKVMAPSPAFIRH